MQIDQEELHVRIKTLLQEHRDLDAAIHSLALSATADQLQLRRLKKRKLWLKDRISQLEDQLLPDIIA